MIVVTGARGFIGSNLVRALVAGGHEELLVVDSFPAGEAPRNLEGICLPLREDKDGFLQMVVDDDPALASVSLVFHQGACTDTTERDRVFMMRNNLDYSIALARFCQKRSIPLIYASSAAVYGTGTSFSEERGNEAPINEYAESKKLFDDWVRDEVLPSPSAQIVGLRYFNVYGPRENHKGNMASVAFKMHRQLEQSRKVTLFEGSHGFDDGEQKRDFVYVDDVVAANLWFMEHPEVSGIFNCGTGEAAPFNDVAAAVLAHAGKGEIEYVPFPDQLRDRYQAWTEADLTRLRAVGCDQSFRSVPEGVKTYMEWLDRTEGMSA